MRKAVRAGAATAAINVVPESHLHFAHRIDADGGPTGFGFIGVGALLEYTNEETFVIARRRLHVGANSLAQIGYDQRPHEIVVAVVRSPTLYFDFAVRHISEEK